MTPEQVARFILSDCQDLELRRIAYAELSEQLATPEGRAALRAAAEALADAIDRQIVEDITKDLTP